MPENSNKIIEMLDFVSAKLSITAAVNNNLVRLG